MILQGVRCQPMNPLNGFSANTESGRLRNLMKSCGNPIVESVNPSKSDVCITCYKSPEVQPPITPAESSRLAIKIASCGGAPSGYVTQSRARELLKAQASSRQQFGSEGVRIERMIQETLTCSTDPFDTTSRFSEFNRIPDPFLCPPLPNPPAPPARSCPLTKNQKY